MPDRTEQELALHLATRLETLDCPDVGVVDAVHSVVAVMIYALQSGDITTGELTDLTRKLTADEDLGAFVLRVAKAA